MASKYYLDASIWVDLYDGRVGYFGEQLGRFAGLLLYSLLRNKHKLVITDVLISELETVYSLEEINGMFKPFEGILERFTATKVQRDESNRIATMRALPPGDALHAIIARDHNLILVTRDNHFRMLKDICKCFKPEDLI